MSVSGGDQKRAVVTLYSSSARVELRADATAFLLFLAFSDRPLAVVTSCVLFHTFLAPFLTGNANVSIYFAVFSFFCLPFLAAGIPTLPAVYLRSADAYNGCTKVTEFISVQQTTPTRVGLRGRELQTIAGLRDNVIVFFFRGVRTNKRKERTMMSLHYCAVYDESSLK